MKRTALERKAPLLAKVPLQRRSPLLRTAGNAHEPKPRRRPGVPPKVRKGLTARSGGLCEIAQPGCTGIATDLSHRLKTGMGGRHGDSAKAHHVLSNALHACSTCHHRALHARPAEAYAAGWMLKEGQIPPAEPVLYRGRWRLLGDDGSVAAVGGAR